MLILASKAVRDKAHTWIDKAPVGSRITFKRPARTLSQNDRQWPLLTAISEQLMWHGKKYPPEDWKDYMAHAYQKEARFMPDEDGNMTVPVGHRTSEFEVEQHSDFQTVIEVFCAVHGVDIEPVKTKYGPRE